MVKIIFSISMISLLIVSCGSAMDDSLLGYTRTAENQYMLAMDQFEDEDCVEATIMFEQVRKKYPYSSYAALSDLRIADCKFITADFSEAATKYQDFTKAHPTHQEAHYAAYRRALSYFKLAPSELFFMPPPYERDLSSLRDARAAYSAFLESYPKSPWRERASEEFSKTEDALVSHEMYVAGFYLSRDDRRAVVVRLEGIQKEFPKSTLVPDAMFMQAVTFIELYEIDQAKRVFDEIIKNYPSHHQSNRAKSYLAYLNNKNWTLKARQ